MNALTRRQILVAMSMRSLATHSATHSQYRDNNWLQFCHHNGEALRDSIEQAAAVSQLTVLSDVEANTSTKIPSDEAATASYAPETPDSPTYIDEGEFGMHESHDISLDIETAVGTLSATNSLDTASKAALVETLEMTPQADWPVVIEEFTATLNTLRTTEVAPALYLDTTEIVLNTEDSISDLPSVEEDNTDTTALQDPVETTQPAPSETTSEAFEEEIDTSYDSVVIISSPNNSSFQEPATSVLPAIKVQSDQTPPAEMPKASLVDVAEDVPQAFHLTSNCLLSTDACSESTRLGMVEEFPQDELCAGSEVIVYFELTGIESSKSDEGFETSIETTLRLDDAVGNRLHSWSLPPLVEVCASVRRDYFARFFVNLPNNLPPGDHQLALTVTDTHAGNTAETVLPFAIVPSGSVAEAAR